MDWARYLAADGQATRHALGWIRTHKASRDVAYLWLQAEGEPRPLAEIAQAAEASNDHALREALRRDKAFVQVRPEGTWALADWRLPGTSERYANALDVVVEVLRELGPMNWARLQTESRLRYPVTTWRIQQCLASSLIGLNDQGLYDLVERGAKPIEDKEPKQPANIQASGTVVGISLRVDHDVLRGSGIGVNRWLTWYLGLRTAPSTRYFDLPAPLGEVVVRRGLSNAQISEPQARSEGAWRSGRMSTHARTSHGK